MYILRKIFSVEKYFLQENFRKIIFEFFSHQTILKRILTKKTWLLRKKQRKLQRKKLQLRKKLLLRKEDNFSSGKEPFCLSRGAFSLCLFMLK